MPPAAHVDPSTITEFWNRVDGARLARRLTWSRLAGRLGIDKSQISRMASGERVTPLDVAVHIARALSAPSVLDDAWAVASDRDEPASMGAPLDHALSVVRSAGAVITQVIDAASDGTIDGFERQELLGVLGDLESHVKLARKALMVVPRDATRGGAA